MGIGKHSKSAITNSRQRYGIIAALLAVLLVVVLAVFGFGDCSDDDMGIAFALSGLYPDSGLCLFVNAFISHLTLLVSELVPGVNAFFLIEYCLVALGIFVFVYVATVDIDDHVVAFCIIGLVILLLVPACTYRKNFTVVATLITLSGFFALIMQIDKHRLSAPLCIVAAILCVFGFMMRFESFLLAIPFVAIALVYKTWLHIEHEKPFLGSKWPAFALIPFVAVVVLCAGAYVYDLVEWGSPEWNEWKTYNHARSTVSDYSMPDYSDIEVQLSAGGIGEIDYRFAQTWRTADKDVFTIDSLEFIASFSEKVDERVVADKMLQKAWKWIVKYWYAIPLALALLALYALRARKLSVQSNVAVAFTAILFAAITFYLSSGGRLPQRVMYSLIADAVVCLAVIVGDRASIGKRYQGARSSERCRRMACCFSTLFCMLVAGSLILLSQPSLNGFGYNEKGRGSVVDSSITGYIRSNADTLFVMDTNAEYPYLVEYGMKEIPPKDELERVILLGGWSVNSPYVNARNEMMGMDNVMKGLVKNDRARYLVMESSKKRAAEMETYLESHYWNDVVVDQVDSFEAGGVKYLIYDFSVGK